MALPDIKYFLGIGENPTEPKIHLSQYDTGNTFRVFLVSHGHFVGIDNDVSAVIVGKKPDGTTYTYNCEISSSQTAVIVPVKEEMTAVTGNTEAEIILTCSNGRRAGTCNFIIAVEESPVEGTAVSQTDLEAVYQAVTLAADVKQTQTEIEHTQTTLEAMQDALAGMQAELREAITENDVVVVPLSVTAAAVATAVTQSQETGEPVTLAAQYVTADPADAAVIRNAIHAGKRVRFDLTAKIGGSFVTHASAERYRISTSGRDITYYYVAFDHADLCGYFAGLSSLKAEYTYDAGGHNAVVVTVDAVPASSPVAVSIAIPRSVIVSAIEECIAGRNPSKRISLPDFTADSQDIPRIVAAFEAGKQIRFDLTVTDGLSEERTSVERVRRQAYTESDFGYSVNFSNTDFDDDFLTDPMSDPVSRFKRIRFTFETPNADVYATVYITE